MPRDTGATTHSCAFDSTPRMGSNHRPRAFSAVST